MNKEATCTICDDTFVPNNRMGAVRKICYKEACAHKSTRCLPTTGAGAKACTLHISFLPAGMRVRVRVRDSVLCHSVKNCPGVNE